MSEIKLAALALAGTTLAGLPAAAHVTLEVQQAVANSTYRATFRIPHGCDGAPTTRVTVRVPEGVTVAQPMPKPGWTLRTVARGEAAGGHGATTPLSEIIWDGGHLESAHYDEFVIRMRLPNAPDELLYIPVVQDCAQGRQAAWTDIPEPGRRITDDRMPAPALRLLPRN